MDSEYDGKDEKMAERTQVKQKKALILLPYLKNGDGTAVALMNYYQELIEHGWRIDFLVLKIFECEWLNKVKADGNNIYELPKENKYSYKVSRKIRSIIKEGKYDIVHVNMPGHVGFETLKMARQYGIGKRIFHAHNPRNNLNLKTVISTKVYDYLLQREATELVACSKSAGNSRFGNKDFQVLKNVIDTDRFVYRLEDRRYIREKLHIEKKVVVGVVGRFAAQKNPEFLLECFAEYNKLNKESVLLWIGDGELQEKIQDRAKNMGLKGACLFVGRKNNIEKWYSAMDLFLLPSKFEGMGIVFLEAQCTGLPCFGSTNVPIETEVTELMHRISLKQEANYWATAMKKVTSLDGIWVPWFTGKLKERKIREINVLAMDYVHLMTYAMVALILVGPEILKIFADQRYWEGMSIIPPIALANYMIFMYTMYVYIEHYYKKTVYITKNTLIAAGLNVILNFILIPKYGYVAAAYTTLASYFVAFILHSRYAKKIEPDIYPLKMFALPLLHVGGAIILYYPLLNFWTLRWGILFVYLIIVLIKERFRIGTLVPVLAEKCSFFKEK